MSLEYMADSYLHGSSFHDNDDDPPHSSGGAPLPKYWFSVRKPITSSRVQNRMHRTSFFDVYISLIQCLVAESVSNLSGFKHMSLKR